MVKRQMENVKKLQRALRCRKNNYFYTKYLSKANANIKKVLSEEKEIYNVLRQQLKENKDQNKKLKNNQRLIEQQVEQLEQQFEGKYFQDLMAQEIKNYTSLVSSKFDDLKKMVFKQDFELKESNQIPDNKAYRMVVNRVQVIKSNRKKIYQYLINIHLFINLIKQKVERYDQSKDKLNLEKKNNQTLQHNQTAQSQELYRELQSLEKENQVWCQKRQGQELYLQNLSNYQFLKQQYSQIQQAANQYNVYKTKDEQLKQRKLGILNELKQNIYKTEQIINQNIHLDSDDLNSVILLENAVKEYRQVCLERNNLKEQIKQAINHKQVQQLNEYENQIKRIKLVLVKQIPQIDNLSQEEIQKEIVAVKTKISNLDQQISRSQTQIQDIKKRRYESLKKGEELKNKLLDIETQIEQIDRSINVECHQSKQIQMKLLQVKLKTIQSQEQLLADLIQINKDIDGYYKNNDANEIQKEFETFISQLSQEGPNHINVSFEQHSCNIFEEEQKLLFKKKTLIMEELAKFEQLSNEVKIVSQTIKKTIKKYKQQKERIKRRSQLFDLVIRK